MTIARTVAAAVAILGTAVLVGAALPGTGIAGWAVSGVAVLVGLAAGTIIGVLILLRLGSARTNTTRRPPRTGPAREEAGRE